MGLLPAALLTELQKPTVAVNFVLEIAHPSGSGTILLSSDGVCSVLLGYYAPWIIKWGTLTRSLSSWRGGIQAAKLSVEIDDTGGQFSRLYGRNLRGLAMGCRLVSPNVAAASYFTWFNGYVDSVRKTGSRLTIEFRQDDDPLEVPLTKAPIRTNTFSALPAKGDATGKSVPYLIGNHDSAALSALGMLECPYVDSTAFRYVIALGWWTSVVRVFVDGVLQADTTDYSVTQILTGDSRKVTLIDFVTASAPADGAKVLVDVQDLESDAGPAACLQTLLIDLVWNDYHLGSFASTGVPVSAAHFTAADAILSTALGLSRAYYIGPDSMKGFDVIKAFGDSYAVDFFWTYDGKLAPLVWEWREQNDNIYIGPGAPDATLALRRVITDADYLSEPEFYVDAESTVNRLLGKSGLRNADGTWLNQRTVMIETAEQERAATVEMPWLQSAADSVGSSKELDPDGTGSNVGWSFTGASLHASINTDVLTDYAESSAMTLSNFRVTLGAMPDLVSVDSVRIEFWIIGRQTNSGDDDVLTPKLYVGGVAYSDHSETTEGVSGSWRLRSGGTWPLNPATGLKWTQSDLNALELRFDWDYGGTTVKTIRVAIVKVVVAYTAAANVSPGPLAVLSRRVNRYGVAPQMMRVKLPLWAMDDEIGTRQAVQDSREGWGDEPWEHRAFRTRALVLDPNEPSVTETLEDIQDQDCSFRLWGKALVGVDGASAAGDGMLMLTPGSTVTVTRAGVKYLDSPAGIDVQDAGPVVLINANCWPSERHGTLIERTRTNSLIRSSFTTLSGGAGSVPTGWTATTGDVTSDATVGEQLFADATVTENVLLLTQNAADSRATGTTTASIGANTKICVSIDRKSSTATAGDGGSWRLVRNVDGFYWNNSTPAWQAGAVDNVLTPTTSWARFESAPFSVGAGATTLTFSVVLLSTATAACTVRVGHVQIEAGEWASSRIVTGAATVTREADAISFTNDCSGSIFIQPDTRGTLIYRFKALWNSADVTAATAFYLWRTPYSAGNRWQLLFTAGTGFTFTARSGAADVTATVDVAVVEGTEYTVYARWTSSLGEWGKTSILTLVVDDGTTITSADSAAYTTPVFTAASSVTFGHSSGGSQLDGYVISAKLSPYCLSDDEMGI